MTYIFGLVIVGLLFLVLHYFTEIDKKQKITTSVVVLLIIFSAIAFNSYNDAKTQTMLDAVRKFNQNKTIICNATEVNNENFTLSVGTYTFIGKQNTPYYQQMISASQCK